MRLHAVRLSLAAVGLILLAAGLVFGSTERVIIERYSWGANRAFVIQPNSYVAIPFNGTRTYTYWRSFWQIEERSTWSYDHRFSWNVTVTSGHILTLRGGLPLSERAFKAWVNHDPEYALYKAWATGGFGANNSSPQWRWWIEDPGNPVIVLINNSTTTATVQVSVGEKWPQFKNQNVQDGTILAGIGLAVSVIGVVFWRKKQPKGYRFP